MSYIFLSSTTKTNTRPLTYKLSYTTQICYVNTTFETKIRQTYASVPLFDYLILSTRLGNRHNHYKKTGIYWRSKTSNISHKNRQ
jgi:hypothetical protein